MATICSQNTAIVLIFCNALVLLTCIPLQLLGFGALERNVKTKTKSTSNNNNNGAKVQRKKCSNSYCHCHLEPCLALCTMQKRGRTSNLFAYYLLENCMLQVRTVLIGNSFCSCHCVLSRPHRTPFSGPFGSGASLHG